MSITTAIARFLGRQASPTVARTVVALSRTRAFTAPTRTIAFKVVRP